MTNPAQLRRLQVRTVEPAQKPKGVAQNGQLFSRELGVPFAKGPPTVGERFRRFGRKVKKTVGELVNPTRWDDHHISPDVLMRFPIATKKEQPLV